MTLPNAVELKALVDSLRESGVSEFEHQANGTALRIHLHPLQAKMEPLLPSAEPDVCACGHEMASHAVGSGLCSHSCDPEACVGKVKSE